MSKEFKLPYPPSANRLWRIAGNRAYVSAAARDFKVKAGWLAKAAGVSKASGPMAIVVTLHPRLTKSGADSKTRIDLDNAIKATLDALNGIAWDDDSQVVCIVAAVASGIAGGGLSVEVSRLLPP